MVKRKRITIVGLGYTGLPLLIAFHKKKIDVSGYDHDFEKISNLKKGIDKTNEIEREDLKFLKKIKIVSDLELLKNTDIFIIAVPTPVDKKNKPNLKNLISASRNVGKFIKKNNLIIYESTVYPGCTEKICVPILEKTSKLKFNKDFFCGYSPERINPGDKKKKIQNIVKITSGSNLKTARLVDDLYKLIVKAGTYRASSIRVAEAAKVIENIQRDLNIAFVNELSMIFDRLNLKTSEVLDAAATKWNFHNFRPGLVGGHCISVDPYYLTHKVKQKNFYPKIILSGRKINNSIPNFIIKKINKIFQKKRKKILDLCYAFKKNCPDFRNTKVAEIIKIFEKNNNHVEVYDPIIDTVSVKKEYKFNFLKKIENKKKYDLIIYAVPHNVFGKNVYRKILKIKKKNGYIFDVKSKLENSKEIITL